VTHSVSRDAVLDWIKQYAAVITTNKDYLTDLDSAIGDADHGVNMDRGFQAALTKLPGVLDKDIGTILKTVGMTLVSTVGGAGPAVWHAVHADGRRDGGQAGTHSGRLGGRAGGWPQRCADARQS
jgi:hypothetical protein